MHKYLDPCNSDYKIKIYSVLTSKVCKVSPRKKANVINITR